METKRTSKHNRVACSLKAVTRLLLLACLCLVLATAETALADHKGKPHGKPGGGDPPADDVGDQPCVIFDDVLGDNVQSDWLVIGAMPGDNPYCHKQKLKIKVEITSNTGHLTLDTNNTDKAGAGRSLFIDFGEEITILDSEGVAFMFRTTDELDTMGIDHDGNLVVGKGQDFDMLNMGVGETRHDVNLAMALRLKFPEKRQGALVLIKLAPVPLENNRHCPGSDPVAVTFNGVNDDGLLEWRIETIDIDHDGDGSVDEDPLDGIDNDGDGLTDEDPPGGFACVTQNPFASQEVTVGFLPFSFGITVTAPAP